MFSSPGVNPNGRVVSSGLPNVDPNLAAQVGQLPAFDLAQAFSTELDQGLLQGVAPLQISVPADLFNRKVYLALLFDDFSALKVGAVLEFLRGSQVVTRIDISRSTPASDPGIKNEGNSVSFPTIWKRAQSTTVENADNIDIDVLPDTLLWETKYVAGGNTFLYRVAMNPLRFRCACDTIRLRIESFSSTAVTGSGLAKFALACISERL